jgi:hypothetical protein
MKKRKYMADGGLAEAEEQMMGKAFGSPYAKKKKPLPGDDISPLSKIPRPNLTDRAKEALGSVKDEYMRGVKRIGQDLGIAKDENQYEDKARMGSIRQAVRNKQAIEGARKAMRDQAEQESGYKKGGSVKSSASKRADGCAVRGKTKGTMVKMYNGGKC